ncbi:40S ribosomal protein S2/30S ribosomal protein S5 [Trachipleistophora hominis]|uniref:Small ribosomal subunit protein uS5 n=1 Tax=Trachipleistophora hominis TaxID=72359 RepID=L7K0A9_TRAHO|nr:40S ribosomal protein S2/30S ribosomal protein S5 [Trachipleistophora hominis]
MEGTKEQRARPRRTRENINPLDAWQPKTHLGTLVKSSRITLSDIFTYTLPIKEPEIVDFFLKDTLKEEVLCVNSVQKQTKAGQRTRIKALVCVGDGKCFVGIGAKTSRDAATAIRGAVQRAKCALMYVKLGYWSSSVGKVHTVPVTARGKAGSVRIKLIPAPKGTGLVAGGVPRTILRMAGVKDIYSKSVGQTCNTENFAKATVDALVRASNFYSPDLWNSKVEGVNPLLRGDDGAAGDRRRRG